MFKDLPEGQTHSKNDGCGEPAHNSMTNLKTLQEQAREKLSKAAERWALQGRTGEQIFGVTNFLTGLGGLAVDQIILQAVTEAYKADEIEAREQKRTSELEQDWYENGGWNNARRTQKRQQRAFLGEGEVRQVDCSRCNDNGCPACDGTKGSEYNPEPY